MELPAVGLDDEAILHVCEVVAYYNFVNRMADGLGVELEADGRTTRAKRACERIRDCPGDPLIPVDAADQAKPSDAKRSSFEREALVHLDALFGLALRLTGGDEARSEDLVQDAILRAWRSWDHYEQGTNCRAWLMTILRHGFINEYRRSQRHPEVELGDMEERPVYKDVMESDPEGEFFGRIVDDRVAEAIQALPEDFRIPLVLSDVQGLGYQEIAEIMEIPVGTVKSRLSRARRRLQRQLYDFARQMGYIG